MKLNETLHNCVMAVASRYPQYRVDIDEDVWGQQSVKLHAQTPLQLLEQLQICTPESLGVSARVECDTYSCEICVVDLSQESPAFRFSFPRQARLR